MAIEKLDDEQLGAKLQEILQGWPLYREFRYSGSQREFLPTEISLFCTNQKCGKQQLWSKKEVSTRWSEKSGWRTVEYLCKNCGRNATRYYINWYGNNEAESRFVKAGQYPPLQLEPPPRLANKLNSVDADLYRKALTSRNNSYGLGALAYLRRIVENKMNDLLDLLRQAAQDSAAAEELKKIDE